MIVGFVCEGPTDLPVFQALVERALGRSFESRSLQPPTGKSGGWTNVKRWCEKFGRWLKVYLDSQGIDLLVIHVDADVCARVKVPSTKELCNVVKGWLGSDKVDPRVIIAIPCQETETWMLATLGAATPQIEQEKNAKEKLFPRGGSGTPPPEDPKRSEPYARSLKKQLPELRGQVPELGRFVGKVEKFGARMGGPPK